MKDNEINSNRVNYVYTIYMYSLYDVYNDNPEDNISHFEEKKKNIQ